MTRMSWPNRITVGRILLIAPFVTCLLYIPVVPGARWFAVAIFVTMALSDVLGPWLMSAKVAALLDAYEGT